MIWMTAQYTQKRTSNTKTTCVFKAEQILIKTGVRGGVQKSTKTNVCE